MAAEAHEAGSGVDLPRRLARFDRPAQLTVLPRRWGRAVALGRYAAMGAIALGAGVSRPAGAQREQARFAIAIGVGATYGNLTGGDFTGAKVAVGVDVNAGIVLRRWQLGVGYDRANHGREDTDGDYVVSDVYADARRLFAVRRLTPYAALRLGRAMASYEGVLGITENATGYIAGIGAGLVVPVAGPMSADVAGYYDRLTHDYGTGGYTDAERGGRLSVRLAGRVRLRR